jgi:predicted RNA-binding Zn ribbon-like protein
MTLKRPLAGEPLALDLVNTAWPQGSKWHDLLADSSGLASWLRDNGLDGPTTPSARRALIETRDAIRVALEQPDNRAAHKGLDRVLARGRIRIHAGNDKARESLEVPPAWRVPWLAVRDLLRLMDAHRARVRRCSNPECVLWFLDTTRSGTRRWCSMAGCGNRLKARRHYRRQHNA